MIDRGRPWGEVELEPEIDGWLDALPPSQFDQVRAHIDRIERQGVQLSEPHSRQLRGKLRELRFYLNGELWRITYYVAAGRRIILLTVFRKTRRQERAEIRRAERAMQRCIAEGHTAEEEP